jgi:hypothetical protein
MSQEKTKPRARIRFIPDNSDIGHILFKDTQFNNKLNVLIINESIQGACLAISRHTIPISISFEPGLTILVKIGHLEPVTAIIRWVKILDDDIIKLGVEKTETRHEITFP